MKVLYASQNVCSMSAAIILVAAGCKSAPRTGDESARREMLALLMPSRIEIVKPFTRVKSFDRDNTPDGIELLLRAVNSLDNPGLMIVGHVRVELFEFVEASAEPKGQRLDFWDIDLSSAAKQKAFWSQLTQMYEFRLGVDSSVLPRERSFVLAVTYNSPLGEHLTDECVIEYGGPGVAFGGSRPVGG
ncbi:MAG: hypothetical protein Q7R41_15285 [Phycisphaerales bacterium]|nr:hypothetical protein [Phycisphaerales bacterium]